MGWYSVIGYFCRLVLLGSKGSTWGFSVRQYFQKRKGQEITIIKSLIREINVKKQKQKKLHWIRIQWARKLSRKCTLVDWTSSVHVTRDLNHKTAHPSRRLRLPTEPFLPTCPSCWATQADFPSDTINLKHSRTLTYCLQHCHLLSRQSDLQSYLKFPKRWEESSSISFDVRALLAKAKLHGEPVHLKTREHEVWKTHSQARAGIDTSKRHLLWPASQCTRQELRGKPGQFPAQHNTF